MRQLVDNWEMILRPLAALVHTLRSMCACACAPIADGLHVTVCADILHALFSLALNVTLPSVWLE